MDRDYYKQNPSGIECIDVIQHMAFNIGSAIKYLWRQGLKKKDSQIKDLEKAKWYIEKEIKRLKDEKMYEIKHLRFEGDPDPELIEKMKDEDGNNQ